MITINNKDVEGLNIDNKEVFRVQDALTLEIIWEKPDYFYIENKYNGTNILSVNVAKNYTYEIGYHVRTLEYSKNKKNWTAVDLTSITDFQITMDLNESVFFRNSNGYFNTIGNDTSKYFTVSFSCTNIHSIGGKLKTLLNYKKANFQTSKYCFRNLFKNDSTLIDAENLVFPSNVSIYCCESTFEGCTSLVTPPILPATTMKEKSYHRMFVDCSALTSAPALPATTLDIGCYNSMFSGCSSLTTSPVLPATDGYFSYYDYMFSDCSSLNDVTVYLNSPGWETSFNNWLLNVSQTGTFHNLGTATYPSGPSGIPTGWIEVNS